MSRIQPHNWLALDNVDLTSSVNSSWMNIRQMKEVSAQIAVTTTGNNGVFTIEVSNQQVDPVKLNADQSLITIFGTVTLSPIISALASTDTVITANMSDMSFEWIRIKFTRGSTYTNGTATAYIVAKA